VALRIGLIAWALWVVATAARSQDFERSFAQGAHHVGLSAGWGHGYELGQPQDEPEMLALVPHVGVGLTGPVGDGWSRGALDLTLEPQLLLNFDPDGKRAAGAALYLRYNLLSAGRLVPFVGGGAGMAGLDFDGRHQDDGFSFILQAGSGAHLFVARRTALTFDARWHHISNAGLHGPNHGIDSALLLAGATWFFR
jgi:hypothetical protein